MCDGGAAALQGLSRVDYDNNKSVTFIVVMSAGSRGAATALAAAPAGAGHATGGRAGHAGPRGRVLRARHGALCQQMQTS